MTTPNNPYTADFTPITGSLAVGASAVQIASATPVRNSIRIVAAKANTGTIYVGFANTVTAGVASAGSSPTTDGYELQASGVLELSAAEFGGTTANIWFIASAASQGIYFLAH